MTVEEFIKSCHRYKSRGRKNGCTAEVLAAMFKETAEENAARYARPRDYPTKGK